MIYTDVVLTNLARPELNPFATRALVSTGAAHLCIPRAVQLQLGFRKHDERELVMPDGRCLVVDYVGPLSMTVEKRSAFVGAIVVGEEVLIGSIALADLDLIVDPRNGVVRVNPDSPNIAVSGSLPGRAKAGL